MDNDEFQKLLAKAEETQTSEKERTHHPGSTTGSWKTATDLVAPLARPIRVSTAMGDPLDTAVVSHEYYNCFNYSALLTDDHKPVRLSIGITSPNPSEGKTAAVCNLAAALSLGTGRRTVVVDFNLAHPRIHHVFGTMRGPGLGEALAGDDICVVPTHFSNLFVLPVGNAKTISPAVLPAFREVVLSLFREFDFVIVDLPATASDAFPTLIANQLNGLLVVLKSRVTRRRDVGRLFRKVREKTVLGFILTSVQENDF